MNRYLLGISIFIVMIVGNLSHARYDHYPYQTIDSGNFIHTYFHVDRPGKKPLWAQIGLDSHFTSPQKSLIEHSFQILTERVFSPAVINCAFLKSYKYKPQSKADFVKQLEQALTGIPIQNTLLPSFVFIASYQDEPESVGVGYINLFYDTDLPFPSQNDRHYLHFALNKDFLGNADNYIYAHDTQYWAGVIAHEILHNLGYIHPDGLNGSFIHSFGKCLQHNGLEWMPTLTTELEEISDKAIKKGQEKEKF